MRGCDKVNSFCSDCNVSLLNSACEERHLYKNKSHRPCTAKGYRGLQNRVFVGGADVQAGRLAAVRVYVEVRRQSCLLY